MPTITTKDGTQIYYKDWGTGQPVVFSHGWPLTGDAWEAQMLFLCDHGYRCIAHDRRGHGRSGQPWHGNDMDTYADDLAQLFEALDLKDATMVGHSTGGGEVARYIGRHGTSRVAKAVLVSSVPPIMLKTAAESRRPADRGVRRPAHRPFRRPRRSSTRTSARRSSASTGRARQSPKACSTRSGCMGMQCGVKAHTTASRPSPRPTSPKTSKKIDVPTLLIHGDDDQIVPIGAARLAFRQNRQGRQAQGLPRRPARLRPDHRHKDELQHRPAQLHQGRVELPRQDYIWEIRGGRPARPRRTAASSASRPGPPPSPPRKPCAPRPARPPSRAEAVIDLARYAAAARGRNTLTT